ncbi:amino acid permease [Klebsiella pneumoniae subsp. pneumoniae]|nr:amino acid permease [Klebsiella pneumoniae subsp. pneumoniae]
MSLAYVYARLATKNPQQGGPIAYAGEISPAFGFQTGVLYYHANWIGNLAIGITAVSYLSTFFPILNNPVPAGIACIAIVWIFTFVNMLGGTWVSTSDHHWSGTGAYSGSHDRGRGLALV